ncbi:phage integrase SAM-like domain-containing protein [Acetobacter indonesiensis]
MRYRSSVTSFDASEGAEDMRNMLKRGGTYYVRFNVPEDRVEDVGRAFRAKNGKKTEIVRTLQSRDYREALKRRDAALEAIRNQVNAKLIEIGFAPLHGNFMPDWWATPEKAVEAGLHYRKQIEQASDVYDPAEGIFPGTIAEGAPDSEQEHIRAVVTDLVMEASEKLPPAEGRRYFDTVMGVVEGTATPLGPLADRWLSSQKRLRLSNGLMNRHQRVLAVLGEYLVSSSGSKNSLPDTVFRSYSMQNVDKKLARRFREWLEEKGKGANTINSYLSSLRSFWTWLVDAGEAESNPWAGMSGGLKKLAKKEIEEGDKKRPFTDVEIITLLTGEPNSRDPRMAETIHDVFRLGLLTGARQNELCSLTVGRVVVPDNPEDEL